ncbi:hypothetical protein LIER_36985 [Lithospermum erythrorhizon]|uniref:Uncharacterized protein n=1 Tax=Lithospermum erythrorhizon TaxID=34254 RepID=A0AAV3PEF5_LITER
MTSLLLSFSLFLLATTSFWTASGDFVIYGRVINLNDSNIDTAISTFDYIFIDSMLLDQMHNQIAEIRENFDVILKQENLVGYDANTLPVPFDLNEADKAKVVACHSEKLAGAYRPLDLPSEL